ncbi:MAG: ABC transporter permease [Candidatus Obscuribacterales bacterium]|nr:ABC transporter permease [Candidatus Obscuribacterales bacterium]
MTVDLETKPNNSAKAPLEGTSNLSPLTQTRMVDLWHFRELTKLMVKRDLMGRYRGSLLGSFWPLINPAGHLLLYTFLFSIVLKVKFGNSGSSSNFALYMMTGLIPWSAFAESISRSTTVILENPNLVKRVVFPLEILPLVAVISSYLSQMLALSILFVATTFYLGTIHPTMLFLPLISLSLLLFSAGVSWFLASLGVYVRDTKHFITLGLSAWMYATPIVYPASALPKEFKWLATANPMYGIVNDFRRILLEGLPPDWTSYAMYTSIAIVSWFAGYFFFSKTKKTFIDIM